MAVAPTQAHNVSVSIGASTQYILSTSGRASSMLRYKRLLEGLGLDIAYMPISSPTESGRIEPNCFAMALRGINSIGGAISRDIKGTIKDYIDEVDEFAADIGAVNTVVRKGNKLIGYNTDASGFEISIRNGIHHKHVSSAVVYGYGGVTAVVVAVLKRMNIDVSITGRRPEEATKRAVELGVAVFDANIHKPQLFINAAPIADQDLEIVPKFMEALQNCTVVFDHEMPGAKLKEYCTLNHVHHIPGTDMYYPQMAAQWKLFLKDIIPESTDIEQLLKDAENEEIR